LQKMKEGAPAPEPMRTRPKLTRVSRWYCDIYYTLSKSRQLGSGGEYFIPQSEFNALFSIRKIDNVETRLRIVRVIQKADEALLSVRAEKRAADLKKAKV